MNAWMILWKTVFVIGVGIFAVMSLWVIVAGFRDIKRLLEKIKKDHGDM